ncbi:MAG: hypothetical protein J6B94_11385 [Lachnospiraceae bacterium]|nr:hypothetical protein [Lachnospiraceae bacterium]
MRKYFKRILALMLAVAMVVPSVPMTASAAADGTVCGFEEHTHTDECYKLSCAHVHADCYTYGEWQTSKPDSSDYEETQGSKITDSEAYASAYATALKNANTDSSSYKSAYESAYESGKSSDAYTDAYNKAYYFAYNNWLDKSTYHNESASTAAAESACVYILTGLAKAAGAAAYAESVAGETTFYRTKTCTHEHVSDCYTLNCTKTEHTHGPACYTYKITWVNADGTTLETDENVRYDSTPSYDGETPTQTGTDGKVYVFEGWTPEIVSVKENATYTATYREVGVSSVEFKNPTGATITISDGSNNIESGANVSANTELTVTVAPEAGYKVTKISVTDKAGENVVLTNGKFRTNANKEDAYTISADTEFIGSKVTKVELGENLTSASLTVDGKSYTVGDVIAEDGKTVVVTTVAKAGYEAKEMTVIPGKGEKFGVKAEDGKFSFVAKSGMLYAISFDNGVEDITSSLEFAELSEGKERNATVTVKVEGDSSEYTLTSNTAIDGILPEAKVTVTITPDDNNSVSEFGYAEEGDVPDWQLPEKSFDSGVITFGFVADANKAYKLNVVTIGPILAEKEGTRAQVNAYDILKMQEGDTSAQSDVEKALWNAFTSGVLSEEAEIEYQYAVAEIVIPAIKISVLKIDIPETKIPIWNNINEAIPTASEIKQNIEDTLNLDLDNTLVKAFLNGIGFNVDTVISDAMSSFHTFGAQETETVKAIFAGNDYYMAAEATATVDIIDLRDASVTTAQNFSLTYGSDLTHAQLVELAQAVVTAEDGTNVNWNANDIEFSVDELTQKDAGTYTVKVSYKGNYDYKPSASEEITVTVNKANATVRMTEDNVVKYENRAKLLQDGFLYTITPDVAIEDTVAHIPFSMELDAVEGKLAAKVDLSTMLRDLDPVILEMVKGFLGDDLSMSLSEFLPVAKDLVQKLESAGIDTGLTEDTFKVIYGILEEAAGAVDVEVTITLDGTSYIPQNHGAYLVGVVTTDPNYNTAYNMTYIVITAEPVVVNFIDENGNINNDRQFVFDGTQHAMTAQAFELNTKTGEAGDEIKGGTYTYYYVGVQSDGTPYASENAPVHAGAYTVTAMYYGGDAQTPELFGMGTGAMTIWANDVAKVDVTDKIATYDEKNPTPVDVMDMITVNPDGINGDKAKIAVITAGLNVAGDFSEDGLSALEGVVNVDFPEKADEILKKIVPSAYADGITLATLNSKLAKIKIKLEEYGIDAAVIDEVMATINSIPDVTTLTFKEQSEVNPVNIGAYFVAAVVFDPDYTPDADAGILLITPEVTEEVLEWTYNDENGVITLPIISGSEPAVNLDAVATVNPDENNAKIKYLFVGIDAEGNAVKTDNAAELGNGVYTEIAYIPVEADATMMIAKPIMRTIVIAPQNVHVDFAPDENIDNARVFRYTGSAIQMPVEAKYLDGTDAKEECLKVTYTGVDSFGNVFENSEEAPVNVGVYAVVATYTEYDPVTGELLYFGMNVGTMAIEPAVSSVDVQYTEVEYDGNPHMATIVNEKGLDLVKIIVDEDGNVNIILPEEWGIDQTTVKVDDIDEAIDAVLAELAKAESFSADEAAKISEVIAEIEKALSEMDDDATTELKAAVAELKEAVKLGAGAVYAADLEVKELLKEIGTPEAAKALEAIEELEDAVKDAINTEEISNAISEVKALLKDMKGDVSEEVHQILDEIEALANEIGVSEVSKLIAEIETVLNDIKAELETSGIKSITINGEEPVNVGTYKVTAIVAGRNYKISSDTDTLVIYPKAITVTIDVIKTVENKGKEKLSPEGFEFVLEDAEGKVIDKQYSDKDGKAQFELTFDKDDIDEVFKYVVKETNTGKKYVTYSDKEYAINISIKLDGNELAETVDGELTCAFVNVYNYTKPSESGSGSGSGSSGSNKDDSGKELEGVYYPESASTATTGTSTGDSNNTVLWISVMGIAVLAVAVLFVRKKKSTK